MQHHESAGGYRGVGVCFDCLGRECCCIGRESAWRRNLVQHEASGSGGVAHGQQCLGEAVGNGGLGVMRGTRGGRVGHLARLPVQTGDTRCHAESKIIHDGRSDLDRIDHFVTEGLPLQGSMDAQGAQDRAKTRRTTAERRSVRDDASELPCLPRAGPNLRETIPTTTGPGRARPRPVRVP